jgi:cob(I)alamin adenosyltransferase
MGNRLTKIYTRTGDDGSTGLGDGARVPKDSARVEAYGTVDETNSAVGVVLASPELPASVSQCLIEVQHDLFDLGGELCIPGHRIIAAASVDRLEAKLDEFNEHLPSLKDFILPGGSPAAAACHVARAVCRRAERRVWTLARICRLEPFLLVGSPIPRQHDSTLPDGRWAIALRAERSDSGTASRTRSSNHTKRSNDSLNLERRPLHRYPRR